MIPNLTSNHLPHPRLNLHWADLNLDDCCKSTLLTSIVFGTPSLNFPEVVRMLTPAALARESPGDAAFERRSIRMFGRHLCQDAFRSLLGIGSARFRRLWHCAQHGCKPPTDGRSLKKSHSHSSGPKSANRQAIIGFLQELYITLSEPLLRQRGLCEVIASSHFSDGEGEDQGWLPSYTGSRTLQTCDFFLLEHLQITSRCWEPGMAAKKILSSCFTSATWQTVCVSQTLFLQPPSFFGMANSICPSLPIFWIHSIQCKPSQVWSESFARSWP